MRRSMFVVATLVAIASTPATAAKPHVAGDCFADLMRGSSAEIVCELPLQPNAAERADLEKQSRGYVKNASCTVSVRVSRAAIMSAVEMPHYDFTVPAQQVRCEVTAHLREKEAPTVLPIAATFAPTVLIRDGKAIEATPGLGNIQGVPRALSWPIETWVNSGIGIKTNMLQVINAWLDHMRHTRPRQQALR